MDSTQPMARPLHLFFPDICAAYSLSIPGWPKHFLTYKYKACYSRVYLSHLPTSDHLKKHPGHLSSFSAPSHPQITYLSKIMLDLGSFIISDTDSFMILFFLLALRLCTSPNAHTDCALYGPCVMSCLFYVFTFQMSPFLDSPLKTHYPILPPPSFMWVYTYPSTLSQLTNLESH